ncbi:helix-turn-helix domain-containing protein [Leifsonia sp. NPDC056824]|uniref:helix-turn-helix domain-containing protein n=1 Tax=Leifsonia sp. NPDC056824 TaxID=3345953 RepID=UPI0036A37A99
MADLAMKATVVNGPHKAVLIVVALKADDKTGELFPSQQTIATAAGVALATVTRALAKLEALGILTRARRQPRAGYRATDLITIQTDALVSYASQSYIAGSNVAESYIADSSELHLTQSGATPQRDTYSKEDHSVDHSEDHSVSRDPLENEFEEFWKVYPRRQAKADALKAYRAARKIASADTILAGTQRYALLTLGKEREYLKLPAGWLRGRRWEDDEIPQTPANDDRARVTQQMGRDLAIDPGYGRPPRQDEMPPECVIHPGYPDTPLAPCGRCERDALELTAGIPEGANF